MSCITCRGFLPKKIRFLPPPPPVTPVLFPFTTSRSVFNGLCPDSTAVSILLHCTHVNCDCAQPCCLPSHEKPCELAVLICQAFMQKSHAPDWNQEALLEHQIYLPALPTMKKKPIEMEQ